MVIEDIIGSLNSSINKEREKRNIKCNGHIVLQKTINTYQTFKAYKNVTNTLWFINKSKYKILTVNICTKVLFGEESKIMNYVDIETVSRIFEFIRSEDFEKIITGEWNGNIDE